MLLKICINKIIIFKSINVMNYGGKQVGVSTFIEPKKQIYNIEIFQNVIAKKVK